jgi:hypothetical protein
MLALLFPHWHRHSLANKSIMLPANLYAGCSSDWPYGI